jgi:hypothetical protein
MSNEKMTQKSKTVTNHKAKYLAGIRRIQATNHNYIYITARNPSGEPNSMVSYGRITAFCGIRRFINVFTRAQHCPLS